MNSEVYSIFDSELISDSSFEDDTNQNQNTIKSIDIIQDTQINETISCISRILTKISEANNSLPAQIEFKKEFPELFSERIPKISLYDYISRIQKNSLYEKSTMILSLIYIDRLCDLNNFNLTFYNIHKIFFISSLIAIKYNEDSIYNNKYYSEIAGIPLEELNLMENYFIKLIDYNFFVHENEFKQYENYLDSYEDITTSNSDI